MNEKKPETPFRPAFTDLMRPGERLAALVYLPIHVFAMPLLLPYLGLVIPGLTAVDLNFIYYAAGFTYLLAALWRFLRAAFDAMLDRFAMFVLAFATAFVLELALSMILTSLLNLTGLSLSSPNNDAFAAMSEYGRGALVAMSVFLAPVVEESLFRGLVFGALRGKSRAAAWIVSVLVFSVYHIWQYIGDGDALMVLLSALLYVPGSAALNWAYERSGSIWCPIFYHMMVNAISVSQLL